MYNNSEWFYHWTASLIAIICHHLITPLVAGDQRDEGRVRAAVHTDHVGGQQVRRERHAGGVGRGGRRRGPAVGLPLHGDVGQDQPQRQGAVPGAAQPGEEQEHIAAAREEVHARPQDTGEVRADVVSLQRPPATRVGGRGRVFAYSSAVNYYYYYYCHRYKILFSSVEKLSRAVADPEVINFFFFYI